MKYIAVSLAIVSLVVAPTTPVAAQTPTPPPAQAPAPSPTSNSMQHGVLVGSDSIVGSTVRDAGGRDIGKVNRLMIDPTAGKVTSVIISTGGTMGVGSHTISVPWESVKVGQDRGKVIVTASQSLENAPSPQKTQEQPHQPQPRQ